MQSYRRPSPGSPEAARAGANDDDVIGLHTAALVAALTTPVPCAHPQMPVTMDPLPPEAAAGEAPGARGTAAIEITLDYQSHLRALRVRRASNVLVTYSAIHLSGLDDVFHTAVVDCVAHGRAFTYHMQVDADSDPRFP